MPELHSRIVGGSTASRVLHCPGSVAIIANMQDQLDGAADELIAAALNMPPEAAEVQRQQAEELRGSLNKSSSYADEGTALHSVMEYLVQLENILDDNAVTSDAQIAAIFAENSIDYERMIDAVLPAYHQFNEYLDKVLAEDGDEFLLRVESRVEFPDIDDAFGTCDVLIRTAKRTIVWDWKFGAGVPVDASYEVTTYVQVNAVMDNDGTPNEPELEPETQTFGNDQLTYYAVAALNTHPDYFGEGTLLGGGWPVELVICQPRVRDELSTYTSVVAELEDFKADLVEAVGEALGGSATYKLGKWCRFAACQSQCPLRADSPIGLARLAEKLNTLQGASMRKLDDRQTFAVPEGFEAERGPDGRATGALTAGGLSYAEALGLMLDLGKIVEPYLSEAAKQAYAFMEAGGRIPGYKLVPKKAGHDKFEDRDATDKFLGRRGLDTKDRRKPWDTVTPAVARKLLKAKGDEKGLVLLEKYVQPGVSSGATIAESDDPRPEFQTSAAAVEQIAAKLKQIGVAPQE